MAPIEEQPSFNILVKTLTGKTICVSVRNSDTILELKEKIQKRERIPPDQQRFVFSSQQLEDDKTISEYKIGEESILTLILSLRGGMFHASSGRTDFQPTILPRITIKQVEEVEEFDLLALISRLEDELQ
jgi:large subunit ribosomal protein L40e